MLPYNNLLLIVAFTFVAINNLTLVVADHSWEDCSNSDDRLLEFVNLDIEDPVQIGKDLPIKIGSFAVRQLGEVRGDTKVTVKINKVLNIFGQKLPIRVPCFRGIGSCEMELCEFFDYHRTLVCDILEKSGHECNCPTLVGNYEASGIEYLLPVTSLPTAILSIGNGDYTFDMKMTSDDKQVACLKAAVTVKFV